MAGYFYRPIICFLVGLCAAVFAMPGMSNEEGELGEWVVKTYLYPNYDLHYGFRDAERNVLKAPALPSPGASDKEVRDFMAESHRVLSRHPDFVEIDPPEGSLLLFDPKSFTLTARLPRIYHRSVEYGTNYYRQRVDDFIELSVVILEAPASRVRAVINEASTTADHTAILRELEKSAEVVYRGRLEVESGERSKLEDVVERVVAHPVALGLNGEVTYESLRKGEGSIFEVDPVIGADQDTIDVNFSFDHHYAPSVVRPLPAVVAEGIDIPKAVMDSFKATILTQLTILNGQSRIHGVWKPETFSPDKATSDMLQVAYLAPRIVKLLPPMTLVLDGYMSEHGEAMVPTPEPLSFPGIPDSAIPEGMVRNTYTVVPEAFTIISSDSGPAHAFTIPADRNTPKFRSLADPQKTFEWAGVDFPEGSFARYNLSTLELVVQNTVDQVELVEAFVAGGWGEVEKTLLVTSHFVEGPRHLIEEALQNTTGRHDHTVEWTRLVARDDVSILGSFHFGARSGQRAKIVAAREFRFPFPGHFPDKEPSAEDDSDARASGKLFCRFEKEFIGTHIEVDPILSADEFTVGLFYRLTYDYALPGVGGQTTTAGAPIPLADLETKFYRANILSQSVFHDGSMRLLGTWRPRGTQRFDEADLLQAVFVKVDVERIEE